jgi:hypothetical protein
MSYKQERKLANFQEAMNPLVAHRELLTVTSHHTRVMHFFTDAIEGCAGVAVHPMGGVGFEHRILSPAGVFTMSLVLCSLHYDTLLRLYGLRRDFLFSLIA